MAEKCTNTSSPVDRWMKPKPLAPLNHFTVPFSLTNCSFRLCADEISSSGRNGFPNSTEGWSQIEPVHLAVKNKNAAAPKPSAATARDGPPATACLCDESTAAPRLQPESLS